MSGLQVHQPGMLSLLQDGGRFGHHGIGLVCVIGGNDPLGPGGRRGGPETLVRQLKSLAGMTLTGGSGDHDAALVRARGRAGRRVHRDDDTLEIIRWIPQRCGHIS